MPIPWDQWLVYGKDLAGGAQQSRGYKPFLAVEPKSQNNGPQIFPPDLANSGGKNFDDESMNHQRNTAGPVALHQPPSHQQGVLSICSPESRVGAPLLPMVELEGLQKSAVDHMVPEQVMAYDSTGTGFLSRSTICRWR